MIPALGATHVFAPWTDADDGNKETFCTNEGCDLHISSAELRITRVYTVEWVENIIEVGTDEAPVFFAYTVWDRRMSDFMKNYPLTYRYDPAQGLIIFCDDGSPEGWMKILEPMTDGEYTVPWGGIPPYEPPDNSEPDATEVPQ